MAKSWKEQTPEILPPVPNFTGYFNARAFSFDGKKILGEFISSDDNSSGIGIYSLDTKTYEKITGFGDYPSWLNDNRRFIFFYDNKIFIGDSITRKTRQLFSPLAHSIQHPAISPDNKFIYFRYLEVESDVWLLSLE